MEVGTGPSDHAGERGVGEDIEAAHDRAEMVDEHRELIEPWGCHLMGRPFPAED